MACGGCPNHGAMTPGADGETADGMSLAKIGRVIDALRHERYRFQPQNGSTSRRRAASYGRWPAVMVG